MMRESNKDGPTDLKTISVDELKKHNHQATGATEKQGRDVRQV